MKGTGYDMHTKNRVVKPGSGLSQRDVLRAAEN